MIRLFLGVLLASCALIPAASAHMIWLERDGTTMRLYFGEPAENLRERTGAALDRIVSPRLVGMEAPGTREADNVAFAVAPSGDARVKEEGLAPREDKQQGGRTRTIFLAREGRAETRGALELELVPAAPGGSTFTLLFRGQPLPKAKVELIGPPRWTKELRTDAEGRVTLPLPWAGRYVAEVRHAVSEAGGTGTAAYDRSHYVATLSFVTESGTSWTN